MISASRFRFRWMPLWCAVGILMLAPCFVAAQDYDVFSSQNDAEGIFDPTPGVFVGNADGSGMKRVALTGLQATPSSPGALAWSPDGKWLACSLNGARSEANPGLYLVPSEGGEPRFLGRGACPSFSPRGKRIVFSLTGASGGGVWVMSRGGQDEELILLDGLGLFPKWSPDGSKIVYALVGEGAARKLTNLVVLNLIEGERRVLFDQATSPYAEFNSAFAWSPDGKQIAFLALRTDQKEELGFVDVRGSEQGLVVRSTGETLHPSGRPLRCLSWSPDGSTLLTNSNASRFFRHQLMFLNPASNNPFEYLPRQNMGRENRDAVFSPDGKKLAVTASTNSMVNSPSYARSIKRNQ